MIIKLHICYSVIKKARTRYLTSPCAYSTFSCCSLPTDLTAFDSHWGVKRNVTLPLWCLFRHETNALNCP